MCLRVLYEYPLSPCKYHLPSSRVYSPGICGLMPYVPSSFAARYDAPPRSSVAMGNKSVMRPQTIVISHRAGTPAAYEFASSRCVTPRPRPVASSTLRVETQLISAGSLKTLARFGPLFCTTSLMRLFVRSELLSAIFTASMILRK